MTVEINIGGALYRTGRMNAKAQFHVARRLLPVLSALESAPEPAAAPDKEVKDADAVALVRRLADSLAKMPDTDCDYVLAACLSVCQRQQAGGSWMSVWNQAANLPQFSDLDLTAMVRLTVACLQDNLGSFFAAPPLASAQEASPPNARSAS